MLEDSIKITIAALLIFVFLAVFALTFYFFLQLEIQYGKRKVARRRAIKAGRTSDTKMDEGAAITNSNTTSVSAENTESIKAQAEQAGRQMEESGDERKKSINLELKFKFDEKALISMEAKADNAGANRATGNEINRKPSDSKTPNNVIRDGTQAKGDPKASKGKSEDRVRAEARGSAGRASLNLQTMASMKSMKSMKSRVDYTQPPKLPENLLSKGQAKLPKFGK